MQSKSPNQSNVNYTNMFWNFNKEYSLLEKTIVNANVTSLQETSTGTYVKFYGHDLQIN